MSDRRLQAPTRNGEVLVQPARSEWDSMIQANRESAAQWGFLVAGVGAGELRSLARSETLALASEYSSKLAVPVRPTTDSSQPIVATGHQPDLYHPGVWVKDLLLDRFGRESGAAAFDLVVDTDGFESVEAVSPCLKPEPERCRHYLALGTAESWYASAPVPGHDELETFGESVDAALATLGVPELRDHFSAFRLALDSASRDAANLADLVTLARRRFEAAAGTGYLELPMTSLCRSEAFVRFVVDVALDAERFARDYNSELAEYRRLTGTRSAAQPVPDLRTEDGIEIPFWALLDGRRRSVSARRDGARVHLVCDGESLAGLPMDADAAVRVILDSPAQFAPKALALSMFVRMFCCDLFIHGTGGGRYDRVTDGVIRRYFGVEAPLFVVASMTLQLPLSVQAITAEEVSAAKERLNRLEHNPDTLLSDVDFGDPADRERALRLAAEKSSLVARIAEPEADKKALGLRIRGVNAELGELVSALRAAYVEELERLTTLHAASEVLADRHYPFCFWDPAEVAAALA